MTENNNYGYLAISGSEDKATTKLTQDMYQFSREMQQRGYVTTRREHTFSYTVPKEVRRKEQKAEEKKTLFKIQ